MSGRQRYIQDMRLSENFRLGEPNMLCPCGCYPSDDVIENLRLVCVSVDDVFRKPIGQAVHVISGHRCARYNEQIGGAPESLHIVGKALDFKMRGRTGEFLRGWAERAIYDDRLRDGGIGTYIDHPASLHYDQRDSDPGRWVH